MRFLKTSKPEVIFILVGKLKYKLTRLKVDKRYFTSIMEVRRKRGGVSEFPILVIKPLPILQAGYRLQAECFYTSVFTRYRGVIPHLLLTNITKAAETVRDSATILVSGTLHTITKRYPTRNGLCVSFSIKNGVNLLYCKAYAEHCDFVSQLALGEQVEVSGLLYPRAFTKNLQKRRTIEVSVYQIKKQGVIIHE